MRSATGTKSGDPSLVTRATKLVSAVLVGPSFHDGSGSTGAGTTGGAGGGAGAAAGGGAGAGATGSGALAQAASPSTRIALIEAVLFLICTAVPCRLRAGFHCWSGASRGVTARLGVAIASQASFTAHAAHAAVSARRAWIGSTVSVRAAELARSALELGAAFNLAGGELQAGGVAHAGREAIVAAVLVRRRTEVRRTAATRSTARANRSTAGDSAAGTGWSWGSSAAIHDAKPGKATGRNQHDSPAPHPRTPPRTDMKHELSPSPFACSTGFCGEVPLVFATTSDFGKRSRTTFSGRDGR